MEIYLRPDQKTVNGAVSEMPSFTAQEFRGFREGKKNPAYPAVICEVNGKQIRTPFNVVEYGEAHGSAVELPDGRTKYTLPDSCYAEAGDRFPTPVKERVIAARERVRLKEAR